MIQSNSWKWLEVKQKEIWTTPAPEVYALAHRWKKDGRRQVLDLGCGIGRHALFLAEAGFAVSAFDLSAEAVEILAAKSKELNTAIELKSSDMLDLPYENASFDSIIAFHVIYHTTEAGIQRVFSEISRILKPGGEVFLTLLSKQDPSFHDKSHKKISENVLIKLEGVEKDIPHIYLDENQVLALLTDFTIVDFYHKEEIRAGSRNCHYFLLIQKN